LSSKERRLILTFRRISLRLHDDGRRRSLAMIDIVLYGGRAMSRRTERRMSTLMVSRSSVSESLDRSALFAETFGHPRSGDGCSTDGGKK
jgi:hypothetical protein